MWWRVRRCQVQGAQALRFALRSVCSQTTSCRLEAPPPVAHFIQERVQCTVGTVVRDDSPTFPAERTRHRDASAGSLSGDVLFFSSALRRACHEAEISAHPDRACPLDSRDSSQGGDRRMRFRRAALLFMLLVALVAILPADAAKKKRKAKKAKPAEADRQV